METEGVANGGGAGTPAEDEALLAEKFMEVVATTVTNDLTFDFLSENEEES